MFWKYRAQGLITVTKTMCKGVNQESLREVLRIETTSSKQQCRELKSLVDQLIPALEGLIQTLEQWAGDYARGKTGISTATRNLKLFKKIHRREVHPLTNRLIKIIKKL